jgi:hypothetical protein
LEVIGLSPRPHDFEAERATTDLRGRKAAFAARAPAAMTVMLGTRLRLCAAAEIMSVPLFADFAGVRVRPDKAALRTDLVLSGDVGDGCLPKE